MGTKTQGCYWGGSIDIFWTGERFGGFFAYELPLSDSPARDERADMESMLAGPFICSCKTKNWEQRTYCPGYPWI